MLQIENPFDQCVYYASIIERKKSFVISDVFGDLLFHFRYEAAVWDRRPIPLISKPILIINLDDGTRLPSITKSDFSSLVETILSAERIEYLFDRKAAYKIFDQFDILATLNIVRDVFLRRVDQIALLIRPDHAPNAVRLIEAVRKSHQDGT